MPRAIHDEAWYGDMEADEGNMPRKSKSVQSIPSRGVGSRESQAQVKEPAWSDHADVVLELLRTGGRPKTTPGFAELQNEARTKAIPCEFLDDGSCGASCFCWTGCRQSCASQARVLAEGFALDFSGVAVGGKIIYARNCHLGGQRLCAAYVPN